MNRRWSSNFNAVQKKLREKFHLTHWLDSTSQVKHSLNCLFIIYALNFFFFFFSVLFLVFRFLQFSIFLVLFNSYFFFHHRSQLKQFFSSTRERFSLQQLFLLLQFQLLCAARKKKLNEKYKRKRMKSDLWDSIGMRWNLSIFISVVKETEKAVREETRLF